ncbi:MAG: hypothetical protein PF961_14825 [Planctomycetota bacterium]|jgi:uncharacterized tellurite resistance protein B-like protein|nr:hypothetical protein [Planctomycetota bacterium]
MFDAITQLHLHELPATLTRDEQKALISALLAVSAADGRTASEETAVLDAVATRCGWDDELALARFIAEQRVVVQARIEAGAGEALAHDLAGAMPRAELRRAVYLLADHLANADQRVDDSEQSLLDAFICAFNT